MKYPVSAVAVALCLALTFGAVGCSTKDTVPPSTPTAISTTTPCDDNTPTFSWDAATDKGSGIDFYLVNVDSGDWVNIGNVTAYTPSSTILDGSHTFGVKAVDKACNEGNEGSCAFTCDTVAPTISSVTVSSTSSSATITWTTDDGATSQVEYGNSTAYGSSSVLDSSLVTTHNVVISDLAVSTTYYYRVKSRDACGNESQSGDYVGESDSAKIEATLKESIAAYNESDFEKCLTYVADLSEEKKTKLMGLLPGLRTTTGQVTLVKTENIDIGGSIAKADVTGTAQGETLTVTVRFMKQDGIWKVLTEGML